MLDVHASHETRGVDVDHVFVNEVGQSLKEKIGLSYFQWIRENMQMQSEIVCRNFLLIALLQYEKSIMLDVVLSVLQEIESWSKDWVKSLQIKVVKTRTGYKQVVIYCIRMDKIKLMEKFTLSPDDVSSVTIRIGC